MLEYASGEGKKSVVKVLLSLQLTQGNNPSTRSQGRLSIRIDVTSNLRLLITIYGFYSFIPSPVGIISSTFISTFYVSRESLSSFDNSLCIGNCLLQWP